MHRTAGEQARLAVGRLGGLLTETLSGGLVGALGGALFGLLFGALCWATFGQVSAVWASGARCLGACAAAAAVASLSSRLIDPEPIGWREFFPTGTTAGGGAVQPPAPSAILPAPDQAIRTTGQALRFSGTLPAGSANGALRGGPPETRRP
jgi:hypothetical protein